MDSASGTGKEILFYDYNTKEWYSIGTVDSSSVDPRYIIIASEAQANQMPKPADVGSLKINGFWLALEKSTYVSQGKIIECFTLKMQKQKERRELNGQF